jgi:hypothetical protein
VQLLTEQQLKNVNIETENKIVSWILFVTIDIHVEQLITELSLKSSEIKRLHQTTEDPSSSL